MTTSSSYQKHTIKIGPDEIAIHRFTKDYGDIPILLLHGSIENGRIFYTKDGKGLGPFLCDQGFDVFIPDMRGKGESTPPVSRELRHSQTDMILEDIPAYLNKIEELRPFNAIHLGAHSWGGVLLLAYMARFNDKRVKSMVFFGSKRKIYVKSFKKWWMVNVGWDFLGQWATKRKGYFPAADWNYGSENEPALFYQQVHNWVETDSWISEHDGFDYQKELPKITLPPILYLAGVKDKILGNPICVERLMKETGSEQDNEMMLMGKAYGNKVDYIKF